MSGPLLLNVDDDLAGRYALTRVLRHAGYEVLEAGSATQARAVIAEHHPALVLLDVNLPDANGVELCAELKQQEATADVLVLQHSASFVRPTDLARGLEKGADAYVTVPVEPEVLLATVRSLLRMREAERAVRDAARQWEITFDAISDGVALLDRANRVIRCNRALLRWAGREADDVVGRHWDEVFPDVALPEAPTEGAPDAAATQAATELLREGRWVRITIHLAAAGAATPAALVCVLTDVDDRRRAEEERREVLERERQARAQAEASGRAKDHFLATLSHELRTPLNAVLGWSHLLAGDVTDLADVRKAAATIERNARAQAKLIEDLLDISRATSGNLRLEPQPLDVVTAVQGAMEAVQVAATNRGVSLALDRGDRSPRVLADPARMRQVVWNLVSNAIKFTPSGGHVRITVRERGDIAEIVVSDSGQGIAADALPRLFDPFWQANGGAGRPSGLGPGLAIVRHLVEAHGGSVEAHSAGVGHGAELVVRLPLMP